MTPVKIMDLVIGVIFLIIFILCLFYYRYRKTKNDARNESTTGCCWSGSDAAAATLTIKCSLFLIGKHFVTLYLCFWNMNELLGLFVRVVETQTYISAWINIFVRFIFIWSVSNEPMLISMCIQIHIIQIKSYLLFKNIFITKSSREHWSILFKTNFDTFNLLVKRIS